MKSLIRWSATFGVVGSVLASSLLVGGLQALALTAEQVVERLRPVPVFAITDSQGSPLVASPSEGQNTSPVAGVFISRQDAQAFLTSLQADNPELASGVQVTPVSLAEVYELASSSRNQADRLEFTFVPMRQQVETALTLLRQSGEEASEFEGVPLFIARSAEGEGGYLTIQQGEQQVIPIYFKREDLQAMLTRLGEVQPDLVRNMEVQVVNLEGLIQTLETSNNQELNQILLIPPRESVDYIRSLQQQGAPQPEPAR